MATPAFAGAGYRRSGAGGPAAAVFDIDVDEAGRGVGLEGGGQRLLRGQAGGQAMPFEAAMDAAARQFGVEAAPHRLDPRRGVSYQTGSQGPAGR
jgi:hypothetical protein